MANIPLCASFMMRPKRVRVFLSLLRILIYIDSPVLGLMTGAQITREVQDSKRTQRNICDMTSEIDW